MDILRVGELITDLVTGIASSASAAHGSANRRPDEGTGEAERGDTSGGKGALVICAVVFLAAFGVALLLLFSDLGMDAIGFLGDPDKLAALKDSLTKGAGHQAGHPGTVGEAATSVASQAMQIGNVTAVLGAIAVAFPLLGLPRAIASIGNRPFRLACALGAVTLVFGVALLALETFGIVV